MLYFTAKLSTCMKSSLRTAIVLNTTWNIHNFRTGLIRALQNAGHEVLAIAPEDDFVEEVRSLGVQHVPLQHLSRKGTNPIKDLRLMRELAKIYRSESVDVALQYTIKPNIYGSLARGLVKNHCISTVTGLGFSFIQKGLVNTIVKRLYRVAFNRSDMVAFQNQDDLDLFRSLKLVRSDNSCLIKGSGINTDYFCPLPKTEASQRFHFLFVGRLLYDKGVVELLEAARILKEEGADFELQLVGGHDTDNPSAIDKKILQEAQAKGYAHYLGRSNQVRELMRNADAVVLPSYREGLPRVMLEGLAMAKPLITTAVAGCRETVKDGQNGYLVPAKDASALAAAMQKMLHHSDAERESMGQKGRQMALKEFDENIITQQYVELLQTF